MNRRLQLVGILVFLGVIAFAILALWTARAHSTKQVSEESFQVTIHSAVTNPVKFAKNRFTGGVGAVLLADPATGAARVQQVITNSPAEKAGLQQGDLILQVDGVPTAGQKLAQVVDSIRGFAGGSVALTVQRNGTNLQCVIHRSSWKNLGINQ